MNEIAFGYDSQHFFQNRIDMLKFQMGQLEIIQTKFLFSKNKSFSDFFIKDLKESFNILLKLQNNYSANKNDYLEALKERDSIKNKKVESPSELSTF